MSVKIREQRGKLYLDIYQGGVQKWESLHITLSDDKKQNKELYRLAEVCRSKREAQLLAGEWDIKTDGTGRVSLIAYLNSYKERHKNQRAFNALIHHVQYKLDKSLQNGSRTFRRHFSKARSRTGNPSRNQAWLHI